MDSPEGIRVNNYPSNAHSLTPCVRTKGFSLKCVLASLKGLDVLSKFVIYVILESTILTRIATGSYW
jgi:hypothetical protein